MKTKTCTKCGEEKALRAFYKDKNQSTGIRPDCKLCIRKQSKEKYDSDEEFRKRKLAHTANYIKTVRVEYQKRILTILKKAGCKDCGDTDPIVLDFDHIRDKERGVSQLLRQHASWETIEAEIAKCEVRCSNCHRRKTAKERNWWATIDLAAL